MREIGCGICLPLARLEPGEPNGLAKDCLFECSRRVSLGDRRPQNNLRTTTVDISRLGQLHPDLCRHCIHQ